MQKPVDTGPDACNFLRVPAGETASAAVPEVYANDISAFDGTRIPFGYGAVGQYVNAGGLKRMSPADLTAVERITPNDMIVNKGEVTIGNGKTDLVLSDGHLYENADDVRLCELADEMIESPIICLSLRAVSGDK